MADTRAVKLGRMIIIPSPFAFHWAVKVADTWYEIAVDGSGKKSKRTRVNKNCGDAADSGAGSLGGELVGETDKTDDQIDEWTDRWVRCHPNYRVTADNCQKFAYEFMKWLTDDNFICPHKFDAAGVQHDIFWEPGVKKFARAEDGNAIARFAVGFGRDENSGGVIRSSGRVGIDAKVQAVAGPGLGAWADASVLRMEASLGNVVGAHIDLNVNTGAGVRNGNVDVHLLGYGGRIGADGISVDTPVGGVSACNIM